MTACVHHYLIDSPDGPTSAARCRRCGARREFQNWTLPAGRLLPAAERAAIARVKREERAINEIVARMREGDGALSLARFRRPSPDESR